MISVSNSEQSVLCVLAYYFFLTYQLSMMTLEYDHVKGVCFRDVYIIDSLNSISAAESEYFWAICNTLGFLNHLYGAGKYDTQLRQDQQQLEARQDSTGLPNGTRCLDLGN